MVNYQLDLGKSKVTVQSNGGLPYLEARGICYFSLSSSLPEIKVTKQILMNKLWPTVWVSGLGIFPFSYRDTRALLQKNRPSTADPIKTAGGAWRLLASNPSKNQYLTFSRDKVALDQAPKLRQHCAGNTLGVMALLV